jgi:hypothetical protein
MNGIDPRHAGFPEGPRFENKQPFQAQGLSRLFSWMKTKVDNIRTKLFSSAKKTEESSSTLHQTKEQTNKSIDTHTINSKIKENVNTSNVARKSLGMENTPFDIEEPPSELDELNENLNMLEKKLETLANKHKVDIDDLKISVMLGKASTYPAQLGKLVHEIENLKKIKANLQSEIARAEQTSENVDVDSDQKASLGHLAKQTAIQSTLRTALKRSADKKDELESTIDKLYDNKLDKKIELELLEHELFDLENDCDNAKKTGDKSKEIQYKNKRQKKYKEYENVKREIEVLEADLDFLEPKLDYINKQKPQVITEQSDGIRETHIKNFSEGVNVVHKVSFNISDESKELDGVAIKKTMPKYDMQKANQMEALGALSESMPKANVVAARRMGGEVATEMVEGLVTGEDAKQQLNMNSEVTQHTALAALSFQMWDLHTKNIGSNTNNDLMLFDTDLALFEDNKSLSIDNKKQSPLGQNKLQDMDIKISDNVLKEHIDQLDKAITSQFVGRAHGFNKEEAATIRQQLFHDFGDVEELSIHKNNEMVSQDPDKVSSVDVVRETFSKMVKDNDIRTENFFNELKNKGISDKKIAFLRNNPGLLHPQRMSIKQLAALAERHEHLQGFMRLREGLSDGNKTDLEKKKFLLENLDHLPASTKQKNKLLTKLMTKNPKLINNAIQEAQGMVGSVNKENIQWNTLAKSVYPTLAGIQELTPEGKLHSNNLSWNSANKVAVEQRLIVELEAHKNFLSRLEQVRERNV